MRRRGRPGFSLIECLVVVGIIAVLVGLMLAAVMRARDAGYRAESTNNLKQIMLAVHLFADGHDGRLPTADGTPPNRDQSLPAALLPYLEQQTAGDRQSVIRNYLSPADPTRGEALGEGAVVASSYAANGRVFVPGARYPQSIPDGTSNTVGFAEHYAYCAGNPFAVYAADVGLGNWPHRATFADMLDCGPGSEALFQVAPRPAACDPGLPQTPHPGGMLAALADGSVRQLSRGISPATFWAAVTPDGGEVLPGW
jgi:prepilin-type N-terminal cleavage/methylation domain-containing protein